MSIRDPEISLGGPDDLGPFVELLEAVGAWLWDRGVRQWEPGSQRLQRPLFRHFLADGALLLARDAGGLCGGAIVTRHATPEWRGQPGGSAYLHKLAVARRAAGSGLGDRLLEAAAGWARARALPRLRLDCWDGNETLRAYYRDRHFAEGEAVASHGYRVRLFERPLPGS